MGMAVFRRPLPCFENILHPFFSKLTLKVSGHLKILSDQKQTALSGGLFSV